METKLEMGILLAVLFSAMVLAEEAIERIVRWFKKRHDERLAKETVKRLMPIIRLKYKRDEGLANKIVKQLVPIIRADRLGKRPCGD